MIQFADAEQVGASEWRQSTLLRGRRGKWAMATHQAGEPVLVLDPATLTRTSSLDEVGLIRCPRRGANDFTTIDVSAGDTTVPAEDLRRNLLLAVTSTPAAPLDLAVPVARARFCEHG